MPYCISPFPVFHHVSNILLITIIVIIPLLSLLLLSFIKSITIVFITKHVTSRATTFVTYLFIFHNL